MKISAQNFLQFINHPYTEENFKNITLKISTTLTNIGFEVESVEFEEEKFSNIVIAKVEECIKHPESSKLSICSVNNGKEVLQVLCGAPNVRKGIYVVLACVGAVIPKNQLVIQKTKIAGYESNGMICSADELCIGKNDGTIIEIQNGIIGTPYSQYIQRNDAIIDISITPNRGDCLSYYGIARELTAQGFGKLPSLEINTTKNLKPLTINIHGKNLLHSAFFTTFPSVDYIPSVDFLEKSGIKLCGIPIVDALNYNTELYGQPMHLYDANKIKGEIQIRYSVDGEKLITISGNEIILQAGDIVISDDEKILSLAGIIGDARSMVTKETKYYILESCSFSRDLIFQTIRKYNIHTVASFRFERYLDHGNTSTFPQKIYAYKFLDSIKAQCTSSFELLPANNPSSILCSSQEINNILGSSLSFEQIVKTLKNLQFYISGDTGNIHIIIPSYRAYDIKNCNDIAEEIIRFIGISSLPHQNLNIQITPENNNIHKLKTHLASNLNEVITYPFISEKDFNLFSNSSKPITLKNPINEEFPYIRPSIIPSLLHNVAKAESMSIQSSAIFEIAKTFHENSEEMEVCIIRSGTNTLNNPIHHKRKYNIFDVKEDVLNLIENVYQIKKTSIIHEQITHNIFHPHQAFNLMIGRSKIATIAQIHPLILEQYNIKNSTFVANIYIQNIPLKNIKSTLKNGYKPFTLPHITRELSVIVNETTQCLDILRCIQKISKNRFNVNITEIFKDQELIDAKKKSILISFSIIQNNLQTMTSDAVEEIMTEVKHTLASSVGAIIRTNA